MYETLIPIALGATTAIAGVLWLNAKAQLRTMTQARDGLSQDLAGQRGRNNNLAKINTNLETQNLELTNENGDLKTQVQDWKRKLTKTEGLLSAAQMELDALKPKPKAAKKVAAKVASAVRTDPAPTKAPARKRPAKTKA